MDSSQTMNQMLSFDDHAVLSRKLLERIDEVLKHFQINYIHRDDRIEGTCIAHPSRKVNSLSIYRNIDYPIWKCWTEHCEENYGKGLVGFVKGCLSSTQGHAVNLTETMRWINNFLGGNILEKVDRDKHNFTLLHWVFMVLRALFSLQKQRVLVAILV